MITPLLNLAFQETRDTNSVSKERNNETRDTNSVSKERNTEVRKQLGKRN